MTGRKAASGALLLLLGGCAGLARNDQGLLQPQTVAGPCQVKKFYLLGFTAVNTQLSTASNSQACRFTLINPDVQAVVSAAVVSERPGHGVAQAGVLLAGEQVEISYMAQPGYAGLDRFTVTLEPNDHAIRFAVTVAPSAPPS